jgi:uncharacterized protein (DUF1697 family)
MADLKACFEAIGFSDVTTYIQSGNVLFKSPQKDRTKLVKKIEKALSARFGYESRIVLVTHAELQKIVRGAQQGFGGSGDRYRYDVIFLKEPLTPEVAIRIVSTREGVDTAHAGEYVLYFSRLISRVTQSRLSRIIGLPEYQNMTIRNWGTTTKLLALMEKANEESSAQT